MANLNIWGAVEIQDGAHPIDDPTNPGTQISPISPVARFVEYFNNRVFVMNQQDFRMRIQWSMRSNYTNWGTVPDADGNPTGGWLDLYDGPTVEPLTGGRVLGDRLVVYRKSSITDIVATGDDVSPFLPEGKSYGIGLLAPYTLQSVGQFHIFLANDYNVYMWDGSRLTPIGTPIHNYLRQGLGLTPLDRSPYSIFGAVFPAFKEYWLVIPYSNDPTLPANETTMVLVYDYLRDTWTRDSIKGLTALYELTTPGRNGTAGFFGQDFPPLYPTLYAANDKDYFQIDERVDGNRYERPTDGGVEMYVDTPDLYFDPNSGLLNSTLSRVMVSQTTPTNRTASEKAPFSVEASIDRGQTFPAAVEVTPEIERWGFEFTDFNLTSNVRRYRFHYKATDGAGHPSWRSYTETSLPAGEFFPVERPVGST